MAGFSSNHDNRKPNIPTGKKHDRSSSLNKAMQQATIVASEKPMITLTQWLKQMLLEAWKKEKDIKGFINSAMEHKAEELERQVESLTRQTGRVREEVERWQMRNEEVEQKLQMWMGRAWSLKQVIIEQQSLVRALQQEREVYQHQLRRFRNEAENAYSFTKYECNKYKKVVTHDKILQES